MEKAVSFGCTVHRRSSHGAPATDARLASKAFWWGSVGVTRSVTVCVCVRQVCELVHNWGGVMAGFE